MNFNLKPCPFCGFTPKIVELKDSVEWNYKIQCMYCKVMIYGNTTRDCAARWNRRTNRKNAEAAEAWNKRAEKPEIIRCKNCKHRGETEDGEYNPKDIVCAYWMSDGLSETDYCSYAERREE